MGKNIKFNEENYSSWYKEAQDLMQEHWNEIYQNEQIFPDHEIGIALEDNDSLASYTARDNDNKLIGYALFVVAPNPRNQEMIADNFVIFLQEKYRKGYAGVQFISYCVEKIKSDNRKPLKLRFTLSNKKDFSLLLKRMNFIAVETVYESNICPQQ